MQTAAFGRVISRRIVQSSAVLVVFTLVGPHSFHVEAQGALSEASTVLAQAPATPTALASTPTSLSGEELGDLHLARKRYQAAIQTYAQLPSKNALVWNKIGMAQQQMFNLVDAKKSYETSLKLNPKNADVLNNLATVYYAQAEYSTAEKMYRKALKLTPKSALIYKNLGTALLAENKFKKGWDCYQTALAIDPEVFDRASQFRVEEPTPTSKRGAMNYYLARSYAHAGDIDRAIDCLRRAIDEGFIDRKKVMADTEFASLHNESAFQMLLSEQRSQ